MKITTTVREHSISYVEKELDVLDATLYLFFYGVRFSLMIRPVWTRWLMEAENRPEKIFKYDVLYVDDNVVRKFTIPLSSISEIIKKDKSSPENIAAHAIVGRYDERNIRTKEQFMADYTKQVQNFIDVVEDNERGW